MVEATHQFGPNVAGLQLEMGYQRWYIIGCYLTPKENLTIENFVAVLRERPRGSELLVAGDFTADLVQPEGARRGEEIAADLTALGLEYM